MAHRNQRRIVLAFFSAGTEYVAQAIESLRALRSHARIIHVGAPGDRKSDRSLSHYAPLRLPNEELIVVAVDSARLPAVVKALRDAGEPGVFFIHVDAGGEISLDPLLETAPKCGWREIPNRVIACDATFKTVRGDLIEAIRLDHTITESGKWLLDNTHLLRTSITEVRNSLPSTFRRQLSRFANRDGNLLVCELARDIIEASNNALSLGALLDAVNAYQQNRPLSIAELWGLPVMLRFALIEALASLANRVSNEQHIRETAYLWANRLVESSRISLNSLNSMLLQMETDPIHTLPYFATCVVEQLQDEETVLVPLQHWVESRLAKTVADLVRPEHNREAAQCLSIANAFNSLRTLSKIDFSELFETVNFVERELRRDPAGTYPRNDFQTRNRCRIVVENIAQRSGKSELEIAQAVVARAEQAEVPEQREVCWHLLSTGLKTLENSLGARVPIRIRLSRSLCAYSTFFYIGSIFLVTAAFLAIAINLSVSMGLHNRITLGMLAALSLFPLSELAIQIVNALIISSFAPIPLPKLDFSKGIPEDQVTLVVVPMMLSSPAVVRQELEKLEVRYLANPDFNLYFSLFSDYTDASEPTLPADAELYQAIAAGIDDLNRRYPGDKFLLFHRDRVWSETEGRWIGRERKRGKIEELNRYLRGNRTSEILRSGRLPDGIRYVITLDADTLLPPASARRMVSTIAHPLNRPVLDPVTKVRRRGYSIIQPRVSIGLPGATASRFTRIFADTSGTDPYSQAVSDAQQDLFGEAIFHGKAIYDVEAFDESVGNRFPAERLLSHDLIEGSHAGVGLASDIELFENMPLDYPSFCKRAHRWIRGDWQIAQWAFWRVPGPDSRLLPNPLRSISRWRVLDNLRRSLVPVASMLLLLAGWMTSSAPGAWSLIVGLAIAIPAIAPVFERLAHRIQGTVIGWQGAHDELLRAGVMIVFLPHQAWIAADAIAKVFYRSLITKRNLLEWHTAERAAAESSIHVSATMRQVSIISAFSLMLMMALLWQGAFAPVSMFVALWIVAPGLLHWLNRPASNRRQRAFLRSNAPLLRGYARQTWRFFDDLVNDSTNWLPPDNYQTSLRVEVANRTSPTNIGLWLCSALAARDFGYLTPDDTYRRSCNTLDTMFRLQRYEGHLLNWYDTTTTQPLIPRYVSTVDSGNLLASLWVFVRGVEEITSAPVLGRTCMRGLSDTLSQLGNSKPDDPSVAVPLQTLRKLLRGRGDVQQMVGRLRMAMVPVRQLSDARRRAASGDEGSYWAGKLAAEVVSWNKTVDMYLKWVETLAQLPDPLLQEAGRHAVELRRRAIAANWSIESLAGNSSSSMRQLLALRHQPGLQPVVEKWFADLENDYRAAEANAAKALADWKALAARAAGFADSINMGFLFDKKRKLFGIGYLVGGPVEFTSHYDLLASECRLASLTSIAKGDVPLEHWFALGRPRVASPRGVGPGRETLLSWTGTMFEYLMPLLFTRSFDNSLLDGACKNAVLEQIAWGREMGLPWGVSECAWSALDSNQTYQYYAFGIPALALKPGLDEENVIAPYATMLSLAVDQEASVENLARLGKLGLVGPMGFYDSIDFTRESTSSGAKGVVIYTYMSHHQGMTLLALDNVLHRDAMQRRFHSDHRIQAVESLLFERVPSSPLPTEDMRTGLTAPVPLLQGEQAERVLKENTSVPRVHIYGNGSYSAVVTNSGGGFSRWNGMDLTRWRSDPARDCWGSFLYIRDLKSNAHWSATWQPLGMAIGAGTVRFLADHTEFQRRALDIETLLHVTVAAEDAVEFRRLTITNWSSRTREIDFTSYTELAMAPHKADTGHPAFSKMFIETEYLGDGLLIAHRRPRSSEDARMWAAHLLIHAGYPDATREIQFETDRATFLGRGNSAGSPDALKRDLNGSVGTVIDPIFSLRTRVALSPRDRVELAFLTLAAESREELLALVGKYRQPRSISQAFDLTWNRAQLQFRYLGIGAERAHRFQELASYLLYPNPRLRSADRATRNRQGQSGLWAYTISGDLPILTVTIADERNLNLIREVLQAHAYWRMRGLEADLVLLNQETPSYDSPLRFQLQRLIEAHSTETGIDRPGGVFLRDWYPLPEEGRNLLLGAASVVLSSGRGSLQQQLAGLSEIPNLGAALAVNTLPGLSIEDPVTPLPFLDLPYFNGQGGFTKDGREYAIYLKPGDHTPAPWSNVMANPDFGAMVTESGLGFTWRGNSQMNRISPWNNDPVADEPSEIIYLRDDEQGVCWTPTPLPIRENNAYRARHGQGYTAYEYNGHGIEQELTVFVPVSIDGKGEPVKIYRLKLRNNSGRPRKLSATYFAALVLGSVREDSQLHVLTSRDEESDALLAKQYWSGAYAGHVTFAASNPPANSYSGDRTLFLGRNQSLTRPAGLERQILDCRTGPVLDPALILQIQISLDRGEEKEITFVLGQAETVEQCRAVLNRCRSLSQIGALQQATRDWWDKVLGTIQIHSDLLSADILLNRWLLYQSLSCRFWGRSAFYQSSGALGFRDQLQDSLAFVYAAPNLTRAHILLSAARQFEEGDVQHWWHRETGMGPRTRCSDDLVFLPFVTAHYVEVTGDIGILNEEIPFLEAPVLAEHEQERVSVPSISSDTAPLWEHCRRALDHASRVGVHGVPLMGNGDWNDGMNNVGPAGKGESVWLAWFLASVLNSFSDLIDRTAYKAPTASWRKRAADLVAATEQNCWDGEWYLRAFFDDGSPLGASKNKEARIDSLPQSWSAISGLGDPARSLKAMESADSMLVDRANHLVRLFTPPFEHSEPNPGYIMGYPPGLRENGGQYTHGSLWMAMAWARMDRGDKAVELLSMMNPIERTRTPESVGVYRGEPYAVAADVSTAQGRVGRAGWTGYTGSAAWMYRIWIEEVIGFRLRGNRLMMSPKIPADWPGFEMTYKHRSFDQSSNGPGKSVQIETTYEIKVSRAANAKVVELQLDGASIAAGEGVPLARDGGVHKVTVLLPEPHSNSPAQKNSAPNLDALVGVTVKLAN